MTDTVCTLFELRAGDDTVNEGQLIELSLLFFIIKAIFKMILRRGIILSLHV